MSKLNKWFDAWSRELAEGREKQRLNLQARFDYVELEKELDAIRAAVADGDIEHAVLLTATFQRKADECTIKIVIPDIVEHALSGGGKKAVEGRQKKRWPEIKKAKLKEAYLAKHESFPSDYAVCQHLARLILKDANKWRQIETQLKKMKLIK